MRVYRDVKIKGNQGYMTEYKREEEKQIDRELKVLKNIFIYGFMIIGIYRVIQWFLSYYYNYYWSIFI